MAEDMYPKPSVGRVVHYKEGDRCEAAIITQVNDASVDITIFPVDHEPISRVNMRFGEAPGSVHWPERV